MFDILSNETLLIAWFFVLGAVIGSFLNVVIYRLPNGMSLIVPSSHCPACNHPIRWFDNIPIISWLLLGRRCRDCKTSISARYPLVEGITACVFAFVTAAEFTFKGVNLPIRDIQKTGDVFLSIRSNLELYGILLYHLLLLCTLFSAGMMEIDRRKPPLRLFLPAIAVGVITPLFFPFLHPMPAWPSLADWMGRALDGTAGVAAGGLIAYLTWRIQGKKSSGGMVWGLLCVGIFLGWQAVCAIALLILLLTLAVVALRKQHKNAKPWPFTIWLYTITLAWILAWLPIIDWIKSFGNI